MKIFRFSLPVLSCLLLGAHFSRGDNDYLAVACLVFPLILLSKKEWVMRVFQVFLVLGGVVWIERTLSLIRLRQRMNMPWIRLAVILFLVALFTFLSALVFRNKKIREIFRRGEAGTVVPSLSAVLVTAGLLSIVQVVVKDPIMLLAERFIPGAGWVEVILLRSMPDGLRKRWWTLRKPLLCGDVSGYCFPSFFLPSLFWDCLGLRNC